MFRIFAFTSFLFFSTLIAAQDHWESIIAVNDTFRYLPALSEAPDNWNVTGFVDKDWQAAPGSIGYGDGDDSTLIDPVNSLYLRTSFLVGSDTLIEKLLLDIDYDDAFVAYLNGIECARSANVNDPDPAYNAAPDGHLPPLHLTQMQRILFTSIMIPGGKISIRSSVPILKIE